MRIRIQRRGLVPAVVVTVVGVALLYGATTWGWAALQGSGSGSSTSVGTLPDVVEAPPPSVATTGDYGPIGRVSMVFAGTDVRDGLLGELDPAWLAISSLDGDYRALEVAGLPEPGAGAMSVSPAGDLLAWVGEAGVVVYDPVTDEASTHDVRGATAVGAFSPDGSHLLVQAGGLVVLDTGVGDVVAELEAAPNSLRRAAWRPDGSAVDLVAGDRLLTGSVPDGEVSEQATDIPEGSQLAWSPSGEQLVSLQSSEGIRRLFVSDVESGRVSTPRPIGTPRISVERLLGFSGTDRVAVVAFALDTGAIERLLDVPLGTGNISDLTTLPDPGVNWVGSGTLEIATDTLRFGSTDFDERIWPWSYTSRLVACIIAGVFFLGLFVTRRPR